MAKPFTQTNNEYSVINAMAGVIVGILIGH